MENGQKIDLNLDAPLDVKSSDMLVPVNRAQFLHNRQRWQGHVLPTSLRYEHNGWVAGWYVYEFTYIPGVIKDSTGKLGLSKNLYNNNPTYKVNVRHLNDDGSADDNAHPFFKWNSMSQLYSKEVTELVTTFTGHSVSYTCKLDGKYIAGTLTPSSGFVTQNSDITANITQGELVTASVAIANSDFEQMGRAKVTLTDTSKSVTFNLERYIDNNVYNFIKISDTEYRTYKSMKLEYAFNNRTSSSDDKAVYSNTIHRIEVDKNAKLKFDDGTAVSTTNGSSSYRYANINVIYRYSTNMYVTFDTYYCMIDNVIYNTSSALSLSNTGTLFYFNSYSCSMDGKGTFAISRTAKSNEGNTDYLPKGAFIRVPMTHTVHAKITGDEPTNTIRITPSPDDISGSATQGRKVFHNHIQQVTIGDKTFNALVQFYFDFYAKGSRDGYGVFGLHTYQDAEGGREYYSLGGSLSIDDTILPNKVDTYLNDVQTNNKIFKIKDCVIKPNLSNGDWFFVDLGSGNKPIDIDSTSFADGMSLASIPSFDIYLKSDSTGEFEFVRNQRFIRTRATAATKGPSEYFKVAITSLDKDVSFNKDDLVMLAGKYDRTTYVYTDDIAWYAFSTSLNGKNPAYFTVYTSGVAFAIYNCTVTTDDNNTVRYKGFNYNSATWSKKDLLRSLYWQCDSVSKNGYNSVAFDNTNVTSDMFVNGMYLCSFIKYSVSEEGTDSDHAVLTTFTGGITYACISILLGDLDKCKNNIANSTYTISFDASKLGSNDILYKGYINLAMLYDKRHTIPTFANFISGAYIVSVSKQDNRCVLNFGLDGFKYFVLDNNCTDFVTPVGFNYSNAGTILKVADVSNDATSVKLFEANFDVDSVCIPSTAYIDVTTNKYVVDHFFFDEVLKKITDGQGVSIESDGTALNWPMAYGKVTGGTANVNLKIPVYKTDNTVTIRSLVCTFNILNISNVTYTDINTSDSKYAVSITKSIDSTGDNSSIISVLFSYTLPYTFIYNNILQYNLYSYDTSKLQFKSGNHLINIDTVSLDTTLFYNYFSNDTTIELPIYEFTKQSTTTIDTSFNVSGVGMFNIKTAKIDIQFSRYLQAVLDYVPKCVFAKNNSGTGSITSVNYYLDTAITPNKDTLKLSYTTSGTAIEYVFDVSDFENVNNYMDIKSTDVRTDETVEIERIDCSREKQIIKQDWDTDVSTEAFWWIDSMHYAKLNDFELTVYQKTTDYTHWDGDKWEALKKIGRKSLITSATKRYMFTNACGTSAVARFITFETISNSMLKLTIKNVLDNSSDIIYYIKFVKRNLGEQLVAYRDFTNNSKQNPAILYSYTDILVPALLSEAKFSATCTFDSDTNPRCFLGIHYDNNLCQWALNIDVKAGGNRITTVTGYGYVGVDGTLTGNEIPAKYFNIGQGGFTGTVKPLSVLDTTKSEATSVSNIDMFTEQIVGNESQQWYLSRNLTNIVSHVKLASSMSGWTTPALLPLNNNYALTYQSPSFVTRTNGGINIAAKSLRKIFPGNDSTYQTLWDAILVVCGYPLIYYLNPSISSINYLQQTLGQYAFVHYNNTINHPRSNDKNTNDNNYGLSNENDWGYNKSPLLPVMSDDLSFDIVSVPQEQTVGKNPWSTLWYALGATAVNALQYKIEDTVINRHQNQTATDDTGNKYSQAFLKNLESMTSTEFTVQSLTPTLKSEVTAVKTLDMFYSTSNGQHIEAGPGFVAHNFVAQCIAQSVTSVQLESQRMSMTYIIKALTLYQLQVEQTIIQAGIDLIETNAEVQGNGGFTLVGVASGTSWGWIASLVLTTLHATATILNAGLKMSIKNIEPFLDGLGADHIRSEITAKQSKHVYDVEAKHRYGSKHETFMYPCFGCEAKEFNDERVAADSLSKPWDIDIDPRGDGLASDNVVIYKNKPSTATINASDDVYENCDGSIDYRIAACYGTSEVKTLPDGMAVICGVDTFLPSALFKNENIQENEPVFNPPIIHDYVISGAYELGMTCVDGEILWISCRDTKLIDGEPSNIVYSDGFCGVASSYTAIEIKQGIEEYYIRPWAVTPEVLALNQTGINVAYDQQMYHGFDGIGYRYTDWYGAAGMNKEFYTMQYAFQPNDRLKRSNKLPPNRFMGNFMFDPTMSVDTHDSVYVCTAVPASHMGLEAGTIGEDKDDLRYSLPIFSEFVSTLPAVVKTAQPYKLAIFDGITSLTTELRNTQTAYKTPVSDDFILGEQLYRATHEYICKVDTQSGVVVVTPLVPMLGMTYLGASPYEAWFYNQATRQYYSYSGGSSVRLIDMIERFRDIKSGVWDFINQEVIFPCLATMKRVDAFIEDDKDETDNIVVPAIRDGMARGEVTPPETTIFNNESWFRTLSMPSGLVYQGPNRCIINRFMYSQYMLKGIIANKRRWEKVPREQYHPFRKYPEYYESPYNYIDDNKGVKGWTHNPFLLVTSPLGVNEETDCLFEWEITFAWTTEMEDIVADNEYIVVNVAAETFAPGGKVLGRPTHIYLTKDLFTRSNTFGYYSFRYNSNNGIGNRERLHIWSDGYIAVSSVQIEYKIMTERRNTILTQQADIQGKQEM